MIKSTSAKPGFFIENFQESLNLFSRIVSFPRRAATEDIAEYATLIVL